MSVRTIGRFRRCDYDWGVEQETRVFPVVQTYFGGSVTRSSNKKERYDCSDTNSIYEIKSRKCNLTHYSTTVITKDKVVEIGKRIYFIFNFYDKVAYIEYNADKFQDYKTKWIFNKPNWEIPVEDLTTFHEWNSGCLI
jgi:hypothetical protein